MSWVEACWKPPSQSSLSSSCIASESPEPKTSLSVWWRQNRLSMKEEIFNSYDVHGFFFSFLFFISCGKTSGGSSCAMWASVSWACWARHSEGHYSAGRLALAMALQSCHKGFSVQHLTQQPHSYVCRGFPWKPCKLWCWQTEAKVILL